MKSKLSLSYFLSSNRTIMFLSWVSNCRYVDKLVLFKFKCMYVNFENGTILRALLQTQLLEPLHFTKNQALCIQQVINFNQGKLLHISISRTIILNYSINIIQSSTSKVLVKQKKKSDEIKIYQYAKSAECHFFHLYLHYFSNNYHQCEFGRKI